MTVSDLGQWFEQTELLKESAQLLITALIAVLMAVVILRIGKRAFSKHLKSENRIQLRFIQQTLEVTVIFIAVVWVMMSSELTSPLGKVLFQGTAVAGAIVGLAAQPVISDLICGFIISSSKPFEIGDRLELDNGTAGVVTDITLRHVVLRKIDTIDIIIPNSKLNEMVITNMSHDTRVRSLHFHFNVAYGSDPEKAMSVIQQAIAESRYSVPRKDNEYSPVYFYSYADSSLVMASTVYYMPSCPTEVVRSDINLRVNKALAENGLEIPYNYVNVVMKDE